MYVAIFFFVVFVVLLVSIRYPSSVLSFLLCSYAFEQWLASKDIFFTINYALVNISVGVLVLFALLVKLLNGGKVLHNYPLVGKCVIALFLYAYLSTYWSIVPDISDAIFSRHLPYIGLFVILSPLLLSDFKDVRVFLVMLLLLGGALSILLLFFTEWNGRFVKPLLYIKNVVSNPLEIANVAGYVFLVSLLTNYKFKFNLWRLTRFFIIVVCMAIVIKTGSRGQFIIMLLAGMVFLPFSRSVYRLKTLLPLMVVVVSIGFAAMWTLEVYKDDVNAQVDRWEYEEMDAAYGGRFDRALILLDAWYQSSPLNLLLGLGNSASYDPNITGMYVHIVPIEVLAEEGILAFMLYIFIFWLTYKTIRNLIKLSKDNDIVRGEVVAISSLVVFLFLLSFKQGSLIIHQMLFCMIILLAKYESFFYEKKSEKAIANDVLANRIVERGVILKK